MKITKSEIVYDKLKNEIVNQVFNLDEALNEQAIAERYSVSKTPIREALNKLVQDGYIVKYPRMGYFIKELKLNEFYEIVQLRFVLESGIIQIIISSCTDDQIQSLHEFTQSLIVPYEEYDEANLRFHMAMAGLTKNRYLSSTLKTVFNQSFRRLSVEYYNNVKGDMHKNHRAITNALLDRNLAGAIEILKEELKRTEDNNSRFDLR